jgi:uncharacterized repeat protein (TIGR01451 family)
MILLSGLILAPAASAASPANVTTGVAPVSTQFELGEEELAPPTIATSFGSPAVPLNSPVALSFQIGNSNGVALGGLAFTDSLPSGLVVASPPSVANSCGGTLSAVAGTGSISLTAGTVSSASCSISVNVVGTSLGGKNNSVQVTSTDVGTGNTASASITIAAPPTISMAFDAANIAVGDTTNVVFTVQNPNAIALSGVDFSYPLPAGLTIPVPRNIAVACSSGALSGSASFGGGSLFHLLNSQLAANANCTVTVHITGIAAGVQNGATGNISSIEGGAGGTASASINVEGPPSIGISFNPSAINLNGTTTLQITVTNPAVNPNALTGIAFTDILPSGLTVTSSSQAKCGGTFTQTAPGSLVLTGGTLTPGQSCQIDVTVTGTASGSYTDTIGAVASVNGGTGSSASANLAVPFLTTTAVSPSPATPTYGQTETITATVSYAGGAATGSVTFVDTTTSATLASSVPLNASGQASVSTKVLGAGSHTIQATYTPSGNFAGSSNSTTFTVNKAVLTVTAGNQTKVYGGALPTLTSTIAGFVNSDPASVVTGSASVTTTATAASAVATYPITASLGTLAAANYSFAFVPGQLSITPVTLTVTANSQSKIYGAPLPALNATITGFVNNDPSSVVTGSASVTTTATAASPVASYPITASVGTLAAANYSFAFVPGTLSVTAAVLTVTANNQTKVYGAPLPALNTTITGFVNNDPSSVVTGSASVTTTAMAASPVASYPITASVGTLAAANYSFTFVPGTLSVTPAVLTVTANNQSKVYGAVLPALTATITGFVNSDTAAVVTGSAALSTTATAISVPGSYPITAAIGTLAASNYTFAFVAGTLTISKAGTVTSIAPGANSIAATITSTSFVTPGAALPTGTIQLFNGATLIATVNMAGGAATLPYVAGNLTAVYSGDSNYTGSTSTATTFYQAATSSLSITSSLNPSAFGQAVTFTATLTTNGGPPAAATGTIVFLDGATQLGTRPLTSPQVTLSTTTLSPGAHTITAQYNGDATFPSARSSLVQTINALVTMSATASPAAPQPGQTVTLTANVAAAAGFSGLASPTGQVTFTIPNSTFFGPTITLGAASLNSGVAAINVSTLPVGTSVVTARYSGDSIWSPASSTVNVTVGPASTSTAISVAMTSGQLSFLAVVAPVAPASGTPTGAVQFVDMSNNQVLGNATLAGGKAGAQVAAATAAGAAGHPIVAVYSGDNNFQGSTSAALPVAVNAASSYSANVAAEEIVSLFGVTGLTRDTAAPEPSDSVGGTSVMITDSAGTNRQAQLYGVFGSGGQINFLVPAGTATGLARVAVTLPDGTTVNALINVARSAAGVFTASMNGQGVYAGQVIYAHPDGSQTIANSAANPINLATPTDQVYLVLYGTGLRNAASVTAALNGVSVPVTYFGAQGSFAGLDQINLGPLPANLPVSGQVNLAITVDGQAANTVTANFQ